MSQSPPILPVDQWPNLGEGKLPAAVEKQLAHAIKMAQRYKEEAGILERRLMWLAKYGSQAQFNACMQEIGWTRQQEKAAVREIARMLLPFVTQQQE